MKIYKLCLTVCAITFLIQGFSLSKQLQNKPKKDISPPQQQRPPLPVNPYEDCHIIDAVPLLVKKDYASYKLRKLKTKPLIIEERISADKFLDLKIEQRGCEDVYAKFNFTFKDKKNRGIKYNLSKAAQLLKNLKINPDALLSSKTIDQIAKIASAESKKARPLKERLVCLSRIPSECITDVSLTYKYPHFEIYYVNRP